MGRRTMEKEEWKMKTEKVKLNIVIVVKASEYFAQELEKDLDDKVLRNCFNTNDRELISARIIK